MTSDPRIAEISNNEPDSVVLEMVTKKVGHSRWTAAIRLTSNGESILHKSHKPYKSETAANQGAKALLTKIMLFAASQDKPIFTMVKGKPPIRIV